MNDPVLSIRDLCIGFRAHPATVPAVRGVSLSVAAGESVALVGQSGSGKSQTALSILGLLAPNSVVSGSVRVLGQEVVGAAQSMLNRLRGARVGMVFQDPQTALTPHLRVGTQIAETLRAHRGLDRREAMREAVRWLERVRIAAAPLRARQYPHELSGGMRQRVMIAAALACRPALVVADEPTTALDATVQAEILDLVEDLRLETGAALLLITHDMGVVARMADRVCVMEAGRIVEDGPTRAVLTRPTSAEAQRLLASASRLHGQRRVGLPLLGQAALSPPVLDVRDLRVSFGGGGLFRRRPGLRAVDGVSFHVMSGETLGVVGESGSGKSTLARAALRLLPARGGAVTLLGEPLSQADQRGLARARRDLQIVFQDPLGSLDPTQRIGRIIAEPLSVHRPELAGAARRAMVAEWLARVGLPTAFAERYPHQLSGGQAQRVGIARAMILQPRLVVCDEAVSALDTSVRAQVLELLMSLQAEFGTAMLFISHDLAVVRDVSHRVMVMYLGRVVEEGPAEAILGAPCHPYTRALVASVLEPDPEERTRPRRAVLGEPPSPMDPLARLRFLPSRHAEPEYRPRLMEVGPDHRAAEFDASA